jgi:oxygen-independent coproporphyrinogen-3 oxidase
MFEQAFLEARKAGFDNINVDLIYGIPNQGMESWIKSLDVLSGFNCEHISLYPLTIEEGTVFYQNHVKTDDDLQRDMYELACEFLDKRGYRHYEISNWAYPGKEAVHNSAYWRNEEYVGLGAGAAGYWKRKRYKNYENVDLYIRALRQAQSPLSEMEQIDDEIYACEKIMLGLRLIDEGIKAESFEGKHRDILDKFLERKVVEQKEGMIKIAKEYVFTANAIISEFMK